MPGICGIISGHSQPSLPGELERMVGAIRHYDWYITNQFVDSDNRWGIAHVDLNAGGRFSANGGTHELLHGHLEDGFTRVRFDEGRQIVEIENDPFGMMPLFYVHLGGLFLFATELKAIVAHPAVTGEVDPRGLADLALFGFILGVKTLVRNVSCLNGGTRLRYSTVSDHVTLERTWDMRTRIGRHAQNTREAIENACHCFQRSVQRACSTSPLGVSLSGGLDSRTLIAAIDHHHTTVKSLTLDVRGGGDEIISRRIARCTNGLANHLFIENSVEFFARWPQYVREMIWLSDGMFYDEACVMMPTLDHYRQLGVQTVVRGHGGELARMHEAYELRCNRHIRACRTRGQLVDQLYRQMNFALREEDISQVFVPELARQMQGAARASLEEAFGGIDSNWHVVDQLTCIYAQEYLRRQCAPSMALLRSRVEVRLPFLDPDYADAVLRLPPQTRLTTHVHRTILSRTKPELLRIVNANTGAWAGLPDRLQWLSRKLHGWLQAYLGYSPYRHYVDLPGWLRGPLREHAKMILRPACEGQNALLRADAMKRFVSDLDSPRSHPESFLTLLHVNQWYRACLAPTQS